MINIQKQIEYWLKGADEDWPVGIRLIEDGNTRHGLFFVHLAFEKIIKAHVCRKLADLPPRSHNLVRLLELSGLEYSKEYALFFAELNKYNIEGRYPDSYEELPDIHQLASTLTIGKIIFQWLRNQL